VADESTPKTQELISDLEKSREAAARLMETLAHKLGSIGSVRGAAGDLGRAVRYVHAHSVREMAAGVGRLARRRPVFSIAAATVAGFLVGRALRSR
jgi:hypothetical protein